MLLQVTRLSAGEVALFTRKRHLASVLKHVAPHAINLFVRCLGISFRWLSDLLSHRGHMAIVAGVWIYSASAVAVPWVGKFGKYECKCVCVYYLHLKPHRHVWIRYEPWQM